MKIISDYCHWSKTQSDLLRQGDFSNLDIENIIEELESLGNSEYDKLESHLTIYFVHALKVKYQPEKHTRSWDLSMKESSMRARRILKKNPSLKSRLDEIFRDAYETARLRASRETGLDENIFPEKCEFNLNMIND